ncbi:hypothetical protein QOT17_001083 [Balamuthia mandrillaris]
MTITHAARALLLGVALLLALGFPSGSSSALCTSGGQVDCEAPAGYPLPGAMKLFLEATPAANVLDNNLDTIPRFLYHHNYSQEAIDAAAQLMLNKLQLLIDRNAEDGYGAANHAHAFTSISVGLNMMAYGELWPQSVWQLFKSEDYQAAMRVGHDYYLKWGQWFDNSKASLVAALLLIGEASENEETMELAKGWLEDMAYTWVYRRGIKEYNTNQYYVFGLSAIESVFYFTEDPEVKETVRMLLQYQWSTMAGSYWPPVPAKMSGPNSRSYRWKLADGAPVAYFTYFQFPETRPGNAIGEVTSGNLLYSAQSAYPRYFYPRILDENSYLSDKFFFPTEELKLSQLPYRVVRQRFDPVNGAELYSLFTPSFSLACSTLVGGQQQTFPVVYDLPADPEDNPQKSPYGWRAKYRIMSWYRESPFLGREEPYGYFWYDYYDGTCIQDLGTQLNVRRTYPPGVLSCESGVQCNKKLSSATFIWLPLDADSITINGQEVDLSAQYLRLALPENSVIAFRKGRAAFAWRVLYAEQMPEAMIKTFVPDEGEPFKVLEVDQDTPLPGKNREQAYTLMYVADPEGRKQGVSAIWIPHKLEGDLSTANYDVTILTQAAELDEDDLEGSFALLQERVKNAEHTRTVTHDQGSRMRSDVPTHSETYEVIATTVRFPDTDQKVELTWVTCATAYCYQAPYVAAINGEAWLQWNNTGDLLSGENGDALTKDLLKQGEVDSNGVVDGEQNAYEDAMLVYNLECNGAVSLLGVEGTGGVGTGLDGIEPLRPFLPLKDQPTAPYSCGKEGSDDGTDGGDGDGSDGGGSSAARLAAALPAVLLHV